MDQATTTTKLELELTTFEEGPFDSQELAVLDRSEVELLVGYELMSNERLYELYAHHMRMACEISEFLNRRALCPPQREA